MRIVLADPPGFTPAYDHDYYKVLASPGDHLTIDQAGPTLSDTYLCIHPACLMLVDMHHIP